MKNISYPPIDTNQQLAFERLKEYGKIMVEAAPGTGKTFTGVYIAVQADREVWTSKEKPTLFLTFSKNARVQIETELNNFKSKAWVKENELAAIKVSNYHAFFLELLKLRGGMLGLKESVKPCTLGSRHKEIEEVLNRNKIKEKDFKEKYCSPFCWNTDEINLPSNIMGEIQKIALDSLRNHQPHYDEFAPLVLKLVKASNSFCEWLRIKYPLVILDEFQDSDCCQWEILKLWRPHKVAIFYDRFQMIYGWRKAKAGRPEEVAKYWAVEEKAMIELNNIHRTEPQKDLAQFILELRKDNLKGTCVSEHGRRKWIELKNPPNWIRQNAKPEEIVRDTLRGEPIINFNESTAIICRTNHMVDFLQKCLRKKPSKGRATYYYCNWIQSGETLDERLRNHLHALMHLTDKYKLRGWFGNILDDILPNGNDIDFAVDHKKLSKNKDENGPKSKVKKILEPFWDNISIDNIQAFLKAFSLIPSISKILSDGVGHPNYEAIGYINMMIKATASSPKDITFQELLDKFESSILQSSYLFLRRKQKGLVVLNSHQAKGREFDHVIIPWLSLQGEPIYLGKVDDLSRYLAYNYKNEEDRRLLYVAFTRAKRKITIIYPEADPSTFLTEWKLIIKKP